MKQVTIRLSHELFAALDQAAEQVGRTRAAVARVAIDQFLESFGSSDGNSATGKPQGARQNPYARTRPTPRPDRERNRLLRQLWEARLKERELLARLNGASREIGRLPSPTDEGLMNEAATDEDSADEEASDALRQEAAPPETAAAPDGASRLEAASTGDAPALPDAPPPGDDPAPADSSPEAPNPNLPVPRRRAPWGTRRWMLEAFGPVEPPGPEVQTIEELREWFRASFRERS